MEGRRNLHRLGGMKAVLFDLDETLIDAPAGLKAAHRAVARELHRYLAFRGIEISEGPIRTKLESLDDRMNLQTKYDRDAWWPVLFEEIGAKQKISHQFIRRLTRLYWSSFVAASKPYADTRPTLAYLKRKGYKLGMITDTDGVKGKKKRRIKRLDFLEFFDVVVIGGDDTKQTKPSPRPFELAASKLGLPAGKCVFVGDKPFTDIRGAKTAGMRTILLKRRDWGSGDRADFTINSLAELPQIL